MANVYYRRTIWGVFVINLGDNPAFICLNPNENLDYNGFIRLEPDNDSTLYVKNPFVPPIVSFDTEEEVKSFLRENNPYRKE